MLKQFEILLNSKFKDMGFSCCIPTQLGPNTSEQPFVGMELLLYIEHSSLLSAKFVSTVGLHAVLM